MNKNGRGEEKNMMKRVFLHVISHHPIPTHNLCVSVISIEIDRRKIERLLITYIIVLTLNFFLTFITIFRWNNFLFIFRIRP